MGGTSLSSGVADQRNHTLADTPLGTPMSAADAAAKVGLPQDCEEIAARPFAWIRERQSSSSHLARIWLAAGSRGTRAADRDSFFV